MQNDFATGQTTASLNVLVNLIIHAALKFGTLTCQLLGIEAHILKASSCSAYTLEGTDESSTTKLATTRTKATNATSFLSHTNLSHLDANVEHLSQYLNELTEIDTTFGNVVEDGFIAIALILNITYLHFQSEFLCSLSRLYHRTMFTCLGFAVFLHISRTCNTIDAFKFLTRFKVSLLHLQGNKSACKCNNTYVVAWRSLNSYDVTFLKMKMVVVMVESLTGVLELHFNEVCCGLIVGQVSQIIMDVELTFVFSTSTGGESTLAIAAFIFVFHFIMFKALSADLMLTFK